MNRDLFKLRKLKLKDRQDVDVDFMLNGKTINQKFTEPVHGDLLNAFKKFEAFHEKVTGISPETNNSIESVEIRGVFLSYKGESTNVIVSCVVLYDIGFKANSLTPRIPVDSYEEYSGDPNINEDVKTLETEVFELVYKGKAAQLKIDYDEDQPKED